MGKVLQFPRRVIGVALTLAGAGILFVLLVPIASAGRPSGKNEVRKYLNNDGKGIQKVGVDQFFMVIGKNFMSATGGNVDEVYCWDHVDSAWTTIGWDYGTDSKTLVDVNADADCGGGGINHIAVLFDNGDFVVGPTISIV